jgi:peptidoglycan/LPS O-acetylase OafA/YrhL
MIHSASAIVIIAFSLIFLFSLKGIKSSFGTITEQNFWNKTSTDWIRGIAIVFVMYSHYFPKLGLSYLYSLIGDFGVALFFFMSGYGLMSSKLKKNNYHKGFLRNKLLRIYMPFVITFIMTLITLVIFNIEIKSNPIKDFLLLSLPNNLNWYLKVQIIMYIAFFILLLIFKNKHKPFCITLFIMAVIFMLIGHHYNLDSFWYQNTLCFPFGIFVAMYKEKIYKLITKKYIVTLLLSAFFLVGSFGVYYMRGSFSFAYNLFAVILTFVILTKVSGNSKALVFLGQHSLELYLSHLIILQLFNLIDGTNILYFFPYIALSILLCILVKYLSDLFTKKINQLIDKLISKGKAEA